MVQEDFTMPDISIKGLEKSGYRHPLIHFKGVLQKYTPQPPNEQSRISVHFDFTDVEVIESREPYDFPVAQIRVLFSKRDSSAWGVFGASIERIDKELDVPFLTGKMQEWKYTEGHSLGFKDKVTQEDVEIGAWEVMSIGEQTTIAGITASSGAPSQDAVVLELLAEKTMAEFNILIFADPRVSMETKQKAIDKKLVQGLIANGTVSVDKDGKHHLAERPF